MFITDNKGKQLKITDLNAAIAQAILFTNYQHEDKSYKRLDKTLNEYWQDILKKLKELSKNCENNKTDDL